MKICYLILACEAYIPTRIKWQRETWITHIKPEDDYLCLTCKMHPEDRHLIGFNTADDYNSCPNKYLQFFRHYKLEGFDWIFFCDDDTFVFPRRLEAFLEAYDRNDLYFVGRQGDHKGMPFMSGGAGFAISKALYEALVEGHISEKILEPKRLDEEGSTHGDTIMGEWVLNLNLPIKIVNRGDIFWHTILESSGAPSKETAITSHYCKEEHFRRYNLLLE